jgi:hypothetical protein
MKNVLLFIVTFFASYENLNAQDVITKRNGDDIEAKVLEVLDSEIKYKKFNFLDGPTYTEKKSEILLIRYENGSKDIFTENDTETAKRKVSEENNNQPNRSIAVRGGLTIANIINPIPVSASSIEKIDRNFSYAISLNTFNLKKRFSLSLTLAPFDFVYQERQYYNGWYIGATTINSKGFAVLSEFYWHYVKGPKYSMYSGFGAGIKKYETTYENTMQEADLLKESFHLTFFGLEYYLAPNAGFYTELGFGKKGNVSAGIQYQF